MKLEIPQDKLNSFYEAYNEATTIFGEPTGSSFKDSIIKALVSVAKGDASPHSWVKSDGDGGAVFDSKFRDEPWIDTMVTSVFTEYNLDAIRDHKALVETPEYKDTVAVLSRYYETTGYFTKYISKITLGVALTPNEYLRMCSNKYAEKVLVAHKADPKFSIGTLVDFRAQHSETNELGVAVYRRAPLGLLVLSTDETILSAAVGAKRYKVVPVGNSAPFYIEERYLKKRKKRK